MIPGALKDDGRRSARRENEPIGLREMLAIGFKQRWYVLAMLLLPPLIALTLAIFVLPKIYRAEAELMVKTGREYLAPADGENAMSAPTSTKQEGINSEIALLTSRAVAEGTINAIGVRNLYPNLVDGPPASGSVMDAAVEQFGRDMSADPVKMSNVISVSFEARDPLKAQDVLDTLIKVYLAKHTQVFAGSRAEGYQDSIKKTLDEINQLEAQRSKIKLDNDIYDIVAQRNALITQRVDADSHLHDVINRQATLRTRLAYLTKTRPSIPNNSRSTSTEKSDEAVHARETMTDLRQTEAGLAARYGDSNPDLQRVRAQIDTLRHTIGATGTHTTNSSSAPSPVGQQIDQEIILNQAELVPLPGEIERARGLIASLGQELQRIEQADLALRTTVLRIDVLTDNLKSLQSEYQLARTQEQTELAKQVSVVQVANAIASERPAKPKKLIFGAAGVLLGLLLAASVVVIGILTNKTIISEDTIERLLGLPVLAALPVRSRGAGPATLEIE